MHKPKQIQINIPKPCSQPWEEMIPCGQGRFCGHCQKTVIDFTSWSDAAMYRFFSENSGKVCGRFLVSQTGRQISIPYQPHSRLYQITVALGLTLLVQNEGFAQGKPPKVVQTTKRQTTNITSMEANSVLPLTTVHAELPRDTSNNVFLTGEPELRQRDTTAPPLLGKIRVVPNSPPARKRGNNKHK